MKPVFERDECRLFHRNPRCRSAEELLEMDGMFYLKDLLQPLAMEYGCVVRQIKNLRARGGSTYREMGICQIWTRYYVRMQVFSGYYRTHRNILNRPPRVDPSWDGNDLLARKECFLLTEVVGKIPILARQLRYQAIRRPRPREEIGVWKEPESKHYMVDMAVFGPWFKRIWLGQDSSTDPVAEHGRCPNGLRASRTGQEEENEEVST